MKNLFTFFLICFTIHFCQAQYFQATITKDANDLIFKIKANPGGGNITTDWSDIEFFVRWPDGSPTFNFGAITVNNTNFPGVPIALNGQNAQGSEVGFNNRWFGSSFSVTDTTTYIDGTEYEVFRVALDVPASTIDFQLVHNTNFSPTYLALTSGTGAVDRTAPTGNKFYGTLAMTCTNCPAATGGTNHVDSGDEGALPVELLSFVARAVDNQKTLLEWETASELNNDYFEIQRSSDGRNFEVIGEASGAGTTAEIQGYVYWDEQPLIGRNYYRLRQVDFDGSFEYSKTRTVAFKSEENFGIAAFPNPAINVLNVTLDNSATAVKEMVIYDVSGKVITQFSVEKGERYEVNVGDFPSGIYFLQALEQQQLFSEKIVVKHD